MKLQRGEALSPFHKRQELLNFSRKLMTLNLWMNQQHSSGDINGVSARTDSLVSNCEKSCCATHHLKYKKRKFIIPGIYVAQLR